MSDEKKDSGFRSRIDSFFDKQAKEQQNLLQGKIGDRQIVGSWGDSKGKNDTTKKAKIKAHKVRESKNKIAKSDIKEAEISPVARNFVRITTDYPPLTIGIMTAITLFMLVGIGKITELQI